MNPRYLLVALTRIFAIGIVYYAGAHGLFFYATKFRGLLPLPALIGTILMALFGLLVTAGLVLFPIALLTRKWKETGDISAPILESLLYATLGGFHLTQGLFNLVERVPVVGFTIARLGIAETARVIQVLADPLVQFVIGALLVHFAKSLALRSDGRAEADPASGPGLT